jgi:hypothetical protein
MAKATIYDRYANMEFPPHEHREYPKILHGDGVEGRRVVSKEEELAVYQELEDTGSIATKSTDDPPAETAPVEVEKPVRRRLNLNAS